MLRKKNKTFCSTHLNKRPQSGTSMEFFQGYPEPKLKPRNFYITKNTSYRRQSNRALPKARSF